MDVVAEKLSNSGSSRGEVGRMLGVDLNDVPGGGKVLVIRCKDPSAGEIC